jgi:hypothetical protein
MDRLSFEMPAWTTIEQPLSRIFGVCGHWIPGWLNSPSTECSHHALTKLFYPPSSVTPPNRSALAGYLRLLVHGLSLTSATG